MLKIHSVYPKGRQNFRGIQFFFCHNSINASVLSYHYPNKCKKTPQKTKDNSLPVTESHPQYWKYSNPSKNKSINVQNDHKQNDEAYNERCISYSVATPPIHFHDPILHSIYFHLFLPIDLHLLTLKFII